MIDIHLINPPTEWTGVAYSIMLPNHSIFSLASYLKTKNDKLNIKVSDGNIKNMEQIKNEIESNTKYFGISAFCYNYSNAIKLAKYIKDKEPSSKLIFGGAMATALPEIILKNRHYIDYIVLGDGEIPLYKILSDFDIGEIENIAYRGEKNIIINPRTVYNINKITTIINYNEFTDINNYFQNSELLYRQTGIKEEKKLPIYFSKGCAWACKKKRRCLFCSIPYKGFRIRKPELIWEEIQYYNSLGAKEMIDASDNFFDDRNFVKEFIKLKPPNCNVSFKLYARADDIDEQTVEMLKHINCKGLLIGIESFSDEILATAGKKARAENNRRAIELLRENNILPRLTMILGCKGESHKSANETLKFAKDYFKDGDWVSSSIIKVIPGSECFKMLLNDHKDMAEKYRDKDELDYIELSKDWIKRYCTIDYDELLEINNEILQISYKNSSWAETMAEPKTLYRKLEEEIKKVHNVSDIKKKIEKIFEDKEDAIKEKIEKIFEDKEDGIKKNKENF